MSENINNTPKGQITSIKTVTKTIINEGGENKEKIRN